MIRRPIAKMGRKNTIWKIVVFDEILSVTGGEVSRIPHLVECSLVRWPGPHFATGGLGVEGVRRQSAFSFDPGADLGNLFLRKAGLEPFKPGHFGTEATKLPLPVWQIRHGNERGIMGEMFKDLTISTQKRPKHLFAIVLVSAPQNVVMGTGHIANCINLHEAKGVEHAHHIELSGRRFGEPIGP